MEKLFKKKKRTIISLARLSNLQGWSEWFNLAMWLGLVALS